MATLETEAERHYEAEEFQIYRAISKPAVVGFCLSLIALLGFVFPTFVCLSVVALIMSVVGIRSIRQLPNELTGMKLAGLATLLSLTSLVGATSMHTYIYLTEVPEGYERISFSTLRTRSKAKMGTPPPSAQELDGKRIFVKGYVHPGVDGKSNIKKFILVGDLGTCCFGGQPQPTDMIEVTLVGGNRIEYSMTKRKLGGTLKVVKNIKRVSGMKGLQHGGYYQLVADYLK